MSVAQARSRVAVEAKRLKKSGGDPSAVQEAKKALAEEKLRQYIERTVASAPELGPDQKARLAALLTGGV